jgi:hypothetical protein
MAQAVAKAAHTLGKAVGNHGVLIKQKDIIDAVLEQHTHPLIEGARNTEICRVTDYSDIFSVQATPVMRPLGVIDHADMTYLRGDTQNIAADFVARPICDDNGSQPGHIALPFIPMITIHSALSICRQ